jgi:hypothetical protein
MLHGELGASGNGGAVLLPHPTRIVAASHAQRRFIA